MSLHLLYIFVVEILWIFFLDICLFLSNIQKLFRLNASYTVSIFTYFYTLKRHYVVHYALVTIILKSEIIFQVKPAVFVKPKIKIFPNCLSNYLAYNILHSCVKEAKIPQKPGNRKKELQGFHMCQ